LITPLEEKDNGLVNGISTLRLLRRSIEDVELYTNDEFAITLARNCERRPGFSTSETFAVEHYPVFDGFNRQRKNVWIAHLETQQESLLTEADFY
jgi:hypothetical protein